MKKTNSVIRKRDVKYNKCHKGARPFKKLRRLFSRVCCSGKATFSKTEDKAYEPLFQTEVAPEFEDKMSGLMLEDQELQKEISVVAQRLNYLLKLSNSSRVETACSAQAVIKPFRSKSEVDDIFSYSTTWDTESSVLQINLTRRNLCLCDQEQSFSMGYKPLHLSSAVTLNGYKLLYSSLTPPTNFESSDSARNFVDSGFFST